MILPRDLIAVLWRQNKTDFFLWLIGLLVVVPGLLVYSAHSLLEDLIPESPVGSVMSVLAKAHEYWLAELIVGLILDYLVLRALHRLNKLGHVVNSCCGAPLTIRESLGRIIDGLMDRSVARRLYASTRVATLVGVRAVKQWEDVGDKFLFRRKDADFEEKPHEKKEVLRKRLKKSRRTDFKLIQALIKKSWFTVAYGDTSDLLSIPMYLSENARMSKKPWWKGRPKIEVRRLVVFPFLGEGESVNEFLKNSRQIAIADKDLRFVLRTSEKVDQSVAVPLLKRRLGLSAESAARAIYDVIRLLWLIGVHEHFRIDYRLIPRNETINAEGAEIVGEELLNDWADEGSALLDDEVIVRFDDKADAAGLISYEFKKDTEAVKRYVDAFDTIWSDAAPASYRLRGTSNVNEEHGLSAFLGRFFSEPTVQQLLTVLEDKSTQRFIDGIEAELSARKNRRT